MPRPEWIEVGRVRRSHGLQGEVLVTIDSDNPDRFRPGAVLYARARKPGLAGGGAGTAGVRTGGAVGAEGGRRPLEMESVRAGTRDCLLVKFAGIADRTSADLLRGHLLEIPSSQLPDLEEGEFYPFDLAGLEVRDQAGAVLGTVVELFDTPAQSVLTVKLLSGREAMVPFLMDAVPTVDVPGGYVVVVAAFLEETEA